MNNSDILINSNTIINMPRKMRIFIRVRVIYATYVYIRTCTRINSNTIIKMPRKMRTKKNAHTNAHNGKCAHIYELPSYIYMYIYMYICMYVSIYTCMINMNNSDILINQVAEDVLTFIRAPSLCGLFCKRALQKRRYSANDITIHYIFRGYHSLLYPHKSRRGKYLGYPHSYEPPRANALSLNI